MTRTTNPDDPIPDVSAVKMVLSFTVGMLVGAGFVFSVVRAHFEWSLPSVGAIGTIESILLVAVFMALVAVLGIFVLYQAFVLFDR